jgi:Na+/H+-dicarboxylate symporter
VFGIAIAIVGDEAQPVLSFFTSITVIMMRITQWIIALAPVGVLFLVSIRKF